MTSKSIAELRHEDRISKSREIFTNDIRHVISLLDNVGWCQNKECDYSGYDKWPTSYCVHGALISVRADTRSRETLNRMFMSRFGAGYIGFNDDHETTYPVILHALDYMLNTVSDRDLEEMAYSMQL